MARAAARPLPGRERHAVTLLPGEPAGLLATRTAGVVRLEATFCPEPGGKLPRPLLPALPGLDAGAVRHSVEETEDLETGERGLSCEIRALREEDLGAAVDAALRALTVAATRAEAVLSTRVLRGARPEAPPPGVIRELARDLRASGLPAAPGPLWSAGEGGGVYLGCRGREPELGAFVEEHPSLRMAG